MRNMGGTSVGRSGAVLPEARRPSSKVGMLIYDSTKCGSLTVGHQEFLKILRPEYVYRLIIFS